MLISWKVDPVTGRISRLAEGHAGAIDLVDIAAVDSEKVVTAVRDGSRNLKLISWAISSNGRISRLADSDALAGEISLVSIVKTHTRIITAVRDGSGNLKLISWAISSNGRISRLADSDALAGEISLVSIAALSHTRVVTAVRDGNNDLKLISWGISTDDDSSFRRLADSDALAGEISLVSAVDLRTPGSEIVTAVRDGSGNLLLILWNIESARITRLGDFAETNDQGRDAELINIIRIDSRLVTAVRDDDFRLKIRSWNIDRFEGNFRLLPNFPAGAGKISLISTVALSKVGTDRPSNRLVTAVRDSSGNLLLISWKVDPVTGRISRLAEGHAGAIDLVDIVAVDSEKVVTAVRTA